MGILLLGDLSKLEPIASFNSWLRLLALKSTIEVFYSERAEAAGRLQKSCWFWVRVPGRSRARTRKRWSADLTEEPKKKEVENYIACTDAQGTIWLRQMSKSVLPDDKLVVLSNCIVLFPLEKRQQAISGTSAATSKLTSLSRKETSTYSFPKE